MNYIPVRKPKLCVLLFLALESLLNHPATAHPHTNNHTLPNPNLLTDPAQPNLAPSASKLAGRPDHRSHFLSTCPYLPESDRWFMSKVRHVADIDDTPVYEENPPDDDDFNSSSSPPYCDHTPASHPSARRVNVTQSPYLQVFFNEHPLRLTIDTGAETNMTIVGETRLSLSRNDRTLTLEALS